MNNYINNFYAITKRIPSDKELAIFILFGDIK